jgi:S-DNA-T family DNA segregation ATPase FtsK/SpoIIIE
MARKSSKTSKKKTKSTRKSSGKKKTSARKSNRTRSRKSKSAARSASSSTAAGGGGMSLDRKLDIIGVVLALVGLLTLLSLISPTRGSLTGDWVSIVGTVFGLGRYLFPFGLIVAGLWLVLRNFERIPRLEAERVLGFILLYFNLLTAFHFSMVLRSGEEIFSLAEAQSGGGYVGAGLLKALLAALGQGGTAIALAAWLLIALAMALDKTVLQLFAWAPPLVSRFTGLVRDGWRERQERLATERQSQTPFPDFTPLGEGNPNLAVGDVGQAGMQPPIQIGVSHEARNWTLPELSQILDEGSDVDTDDEFNRHRALVIEETLASFGAPARVVEINPGPTITQFGVEPDFIESRSGRTRVRVSKISSLADDLALALAARTIRIQAPVPGKGFIGIEVPNEETSMVALRDVIESEAFKRLKSPLRFALGQNVAGMAVAADLAGMPHLLIAGATGSGKSVSVNCLISCLLLNNTPNELRMIMVDPKRVELTGYNGIPHLLAPVVVETERVVAALQWVTREMDMRYRKLAEAGARNIQDYNAKQAENGDSKLPYLVVIIDELADLMMLAPDETERTVTRLAQLARATGIHLVIATQRPSTDVVTGLIKANFPARIAFAVASNVDSRVILDQTGAERLLGRGDMLFQAPDAPAPVRLQGVFVSESEILRLVQYWRGFSSDAETAPVAVGGIVDALPSNLPLKQLPMWEEATSEDQDPLMAEAIDLVRRQGRASISMLQRRLRIGYTRAGRLIAVMEEKGIVSEPEPVSGARQVLDYGPAAPPADE